MKSETVAVGFFSGFMNNSFGQPKAAMKVLLKKVFNKDKVVFIAEDEQGMRFNGINFKKLDQAKSAVEDRFLRRVGDWEEVKES